MSETRFRIPRVSLAVMVFGGLGCDSDNKSTASDTARIQKIADDECEAQFHCQDANHDSADYTTQQECVDHYVNKLTTELANVTTDCKLASLEYYECYEALGCGADPAKCAKQNATYETKCAAMLPGTNK